MKKTIDFVLMAVLTIFVLGADTLLGQQVSAEITTDEAYVGVPIQLQIKIANAENYDLPDVPDIDGCKVDFLGTPSRSSQVSIINGRQFKTTTITAVYSITALRAGEFVIPEMEIVVDGRKQTLAEYSFSATKSETGDLLFVEIEGQKESVYVGQPLDLKLKIYLKPFHDIERNIKMQIGDMWSTLSRNSSWGDFLGRMQELSTSRTRPSGKEVIRKDAYGKDAVYYMFEIESTIYPNRSGKIDSEGVQIVVDYPVKIGRARSTFDDLFFNRRSSGYAVTETRPIVATATVDSTVVVPVPQKGRPADYRGAVGNYQIVSDVEPEIAAAGDPITLRLAIVGDGPMELVQAPPLSEIGSLTVDFKTEDQNLAGFVKEDNTKIFVTTIRPRRAGIEQVPAIPFSFFDPDKEEFKTVYSDPIEITVSESEQLSLDAIIGNHSPTQTGPSTDSKEVTTLDSTSKFANQFSANTLVSQKRRNTQSWWIWLILPPTMWVIILTIKNVTASGRFFRLFRSPSSVAKKIILQTSKPVELMPPLVELVFETFKLSGPNDFESAIGALRANGHQNLAVRAEALKADANQFVAGEMPDNELGQLKERCIQLIDEIEIAAGAEAKPSIRRIKEKSPPEHFLPGRMTILLLSCFAISIFSKQAMADQPPLLSDIQIQTIFEQANELYQTAQKEGSVDKFKNAASKYQLLVDSGIQNADLYLNLGNAQIQSEQPGQAMASYLRGLELSPSHRNLNMNLQLASQSIADTDDDTESDGFSFAFSNWNDIVLDLIGWNSVFAVALVSSIVFWGTLIFNTLGFQFKIAPVLIVSGLTLCVSVALLWLENNQNRSYAISVQPEIELRVGDGKEFSISQTLSTKIGTPFDVLAKRKGWIQIRTADGEAGWANQNGLEIISE